MTSFCYNFEQVPNYDDNFNGLELSVCSSLMVTGGAKIRRQRQMTNNMPSIICCLALKSIVLKTISSRLCSSCKSSICVQVRELEALLAYFPI